MRSAHTEEYVAQQRDKAGGRRAQDRTRRRIQYKVRQLVKLAQAPVVPASISLIDAELKDLTAASIHVPLYTLGTVRKRILGTGMLALVQMDGLASPLRAKPMSLWWNSLM
ncbi:unnamed protein product [Boreogadus saida]